MHNFSYFHQNVFWLTVLGPLSAQAYSLKIYSQECDLHNPFHKDCGNTGLPCWEVYDQDDKKTVNNSIKLQLDTFQCIPL